MYQSFRDRETEKRVVLYLKLLKICLDGRFILNLGMKKNSLVMDFDKYINKHLKCTYICLKLQYNVIKMY